jgi:hypothetical protein
MIRQTSRRPHKAVRTFAIPTVLALLTLAGLIAGLAGDGAHDFASWLLLAPVPASLVWAWARRG